MSRLLLDMCVHRRVGSALTARGLDVVHVGDVEMGRSPDSEVKSFALEEGRVVVTDDSDFAQLLSRSGAPAPSVIHVRAPAATPERVAQLVCSVLESAAADFAHGAVASVSERGARIHRLPLARSVASEQDDRSG